MSCQSIAATVPLFEVRGERAGWSIWRSAVVAMLVVAWGVRFLAYATEELGLDGQLSVGLALLPLPRLFAFLARDVHPPLYYLILKAWLAVVGVNDVSARWLSVAAGTLTLALLYRFVASLAGARGGRGRIAGSCAGNDWRVGNCPRFQPGAPLFGRLGRRVARARSDRR